MVSRVDLHFDVVLSLARTAVQFAHVHRDDAAHSAVVHQVRRFEKRLREAGDVDRADRLKHLTDWFDAGGPEPEHAVVISECV